ncbi:MAG: hypothetical protein ACXQS8_06905 [Candidatus Helarchaeales archaeon]
MIELPSRIKHVTINGRPAGQFIDDLQHLFQKIEKGELTNHPYLLNKELLDKVKLQILAQNSEPLPSAEWTPLKASTIERKMNLSREVGVPLRSSPETRWMMFGPLFDSINLLPSTLSNEFSVGIRQNKLYPYIRFVKPLDKTGKRRGRPRQIRVSDYARYVERKRPLFSVFWKYYAKWMIERTLEKVNILALASVMGAPFKMFYV